MTLVKFGFGVAEKYVAATMAGMIYFATDTNQIWLDGKSYGYSTTDAALLKKSIKSASLGADQKTITLTANDDTTATVVLQEATALLPGLMSASDKVALETLTGDVSTTGSVQKQVADAKTDLEGKIAKATVVAGDTSVEVTAGANTSVKVKIKEDGGLNVTEDGLAVDESALTEVTAGNGLEESEASGVKTLKVKAANESIAVTADGVKTNLQLVLADEGKADTVLHQYKLSDGVNTYGAAIEIPKDKNLVKAYMGHVDDSLTSAATSADVTTGSGAVALCLVYQVANGSYQLAAIPASAFFTEQAFGDGLQVQTGVVSVKLAEGNEGEFLTVTSAGVKLSGVAAAIAAAVKASSVTITEVGTGHVKVSKTGDAVNGYTYTITAEDIASDAELKALVTRFNAITGQLGNTYVADSEANFIDDATSLHSATQILDTNLKALQDSLTWFEADSE